jgi:TPR repeat protein
MFKSLDEIEEKYPININKFTIYEKEILSIFNSTKLNIDGYDLNDSCILFIIGLYYYNVLKDNRSTEIFYLLATLKNNCDAIIALAYFYKEIDDEKSMLKYFLMTIEYNCYDSDCLFYIGKYYENEKKYELMEKYYLMGVEIGDLRSINCLGLYYEKIKKDYDLMKIYYLMGVEKGDPKSMNNLGNYYGNVKQKYDLMKDYYMMAIEKGDKTAMNNLKKYYDNKYANYLKFYVLLNKIENKNELITDELNLLRNKNYKLQFYHTKLSLAIELNFTKECIICYNNEYQIIFNCGHYCCKNCFIEIEKCHICKIRIW